MASRRGKPRTRRDAASAVVSTPRSRQPLAPAAASDSGRPSLSTVLLLCAALSAVTVVVFAPLRHAAFLGFDDTTYIVDNTHLAAGLTWRGLTWAWSEVIEGYWPVTWMSYLLDRQIWGLDAGLFHVTNVAIHVANVCLLFLLLRRLTGAVWRSVWVAAFFAVHPLHVEPVAWVAERNDLLCTTFWFAGIWAYAGYVARPGRWRYAAVMAAYALGLLSKPMIITFPLTLVLLDVWPLRRISWPGSGDGAGTPEMTWRAALLEKAPLLLMAAASAAATFALRLRIGAVAGFSAVPLGSRLENGLISYTMYLIKMAWPSGLAVLYPLPAAIPLWAAVGAAVVLMAITVLAWRVRGTMPFLLFGWLWYVVALVPVIGIIQAGSQSRADRYTYVPMIGVAIAVVWALAEFAHRSPALRGGIVALGCVTLGADGLVAARYVESWHDTESLFRHAIAVTGPNAVAHTVLASALRDEGRVEEALPEFREAIRIDPRLYTARSNLGEALLALGRPAEALPELAEAVVLQPNDSSLHINLASALSAAGRFGDAEAEYRAALGLAPDSADAHSGLGIVLSKQGHLEQARAELTEAIRIQPDDGDAHLNLGTVLAELSDAAGAERELAEAIRLRPDSPQPHRALGGVLARAGRTDAAIKELTEAVRLEPGDALTRSNLGGLLASAGRLDEAIVQFTEAVRLRPDVSMLRDNLDRALKMRGGK